MRIALIPDVDYAFKRTAWNCSMSSWICFRSSSSCCCPPSLRHGTHDLVWRELTRVWMYAASGSICRCTSRTVLGAPMLTAMMWLASLRLREGQRRRALAIAVASVCAALAIAGPVAAGSIRQTALDVMFARSRTVTRLAYRAGAAPSEPARRV
jgi:hypothetical protein